MNDIDTTTTLHGNDVPPDESTGGSPGSGTSASEPDASAPTTSTSVNPRAKVLERKNGMIAGVAGGLADYLDVDATVVRLILLGLALVTMPAIPLAYIVAWIIIPEEGKSAVTATPA